MPKIKPLKQEEIEESINLMAKEYKDPDNGAIILKNELYKLRFSINVLTEKQCEEIVPLISFNLKPLELLGKLSNDEEIKYNTDGLYSVLRGHRGSLRSQLAWLTPIADMNKLYLTFAAANDHKRSADKVTNRYNNIEFKFYQRKNSSKAFHEGFKLLYKKPDYWEEYSSRKLFFNHEESYWNNKALFSILKYFVNDDSKIPKSTSLKGLNILIGQTALNLANDTSFLAINSTSKEKQIELFQDQAKYGYKARELASLYKNIEAHLLKKELEADIQLHKWGIKKTEETDNKAKKLIEIVNSMNTSEEEKYFKHHKAAIKALYHLE